LQDKLMTTFTAAEAERQLQKVLEQARMQGEVRITTASGQEFAVRPVPASALDVGYVRLNSPVTTEEIVLAVREGRERG
jgi:hypothetical protein